MKKLLIVAVLALLATGVNAQEKKAQPNQPVKNSTEKNQELSKNFITRMDGRMMIVKGTQMEPMKNEKMKFDNGNYLMNDGVFIFDNGTKKVMLEDGQKIDMNGLLIEKKGGEEAPAPDMPISVPPAGEPEK